MKTSIVQFRMDSELKETFEAVVKSMGLDMGSAFRMFAMQVLKNGKIPFEVEAIDPDTIWTKADQKAWKKARKELERGETISHEQLKRELGL
ncbi:type II toxin-antitoxin system RelB/DinJ family antitoxin [Helicobacter didelphidarum]|nr:type II toxin-antitoxin system RelB/DinJ family antitoxin [Helicobacter didelphidarum]